MIHRAIASILVGATLVTANAHAQSAGYVTNYVMISEEGAVAISVPMEGKPGEPIEFNWPIVERCARRAWPDDNENEAGAVALCRVAMYARTCPNSIALQVPEHGVIYFWSLDGAERAAVGWGDRAGGPGPKLPDRDMIMRIARAARQCEVTS